MRTSPSTVFAFAIEDSALGYEPQALELAMDVRPLSRINTVIPGSFLPVPVLLFGGDFLPVSAIDVASLRLASGRASLVCYPIAIILPVVETRGAFTLSGPG